jgi:hypothetical protein
MFHLRVSCAGQTIFEVYNLTGELSLTQAWAAALPALLNTQRTPDINRIELRLDDGPVLGR